MGPGIARPVLHTSRVQNERHGEQGRVQIRRRAAEAWALTIVDVDATLILQVEALVEANRGAITHTATHSPERSGRVSVSLVAAVGLKLYPDRRYCRAAGVMVLALCPRAGPICGL